MLQKLVRKPWWKAFLAVFMIGIVAVTSLSVASPAQAHCDSEKGPVATAAHQALEKNNVNLILPYVKPDSEAELTAAFKEASAVRKTGSSAKQLADRYFIETAVRLHREGEGAAYTGVTDETTPQAILVTDKAMESGSTGEVTKLLNQAIEKGVREKYEAVVHAREEAKRLNTVEAHRERVEAELIFEKYVYELYTGASTGTAAVEGHAH